MMSISISPSLAHTRARARARTLALAPARALAPTLALALALALAACSGSSGGASGPKETVFPPDFLFGTAVAGFQVDMGCPTLSAAACDDPHSDWYDFITSDAMKQDPTTHLAGDPPSKGPGQWELYAQDYDRAAGELHNGAVRMSIEWSRIFPIATDAFITPAEVAAAADTDAVAHYHAMFAALHARGLKPLVTLNHYTLPSWIHDAVGCHQDLDHCERRGWLDKERTVREIGKYARFVGQEFGGEVDLWATLNEPFAVLLPGYLQPSADRTNPPAVTGRGAEGKIVLAGLIEAHARMYDALHAGDTMDADGDGTAASVGIVYSMSPVRAKDPQKPLDVTAADNVFYLLNMVYLNAVAAGDFDENLDRHPVHRDDLANRMDYVGINYYTRVTVEGLGASVMPSLSPLATFNPLTIQPWEDYPEGIREMANIIDGHFHLPVIITENGKDDPHDDGSAPPYLVRHLRSLGRAMDDGVDVRGYFYWSLIDNYEWNHGMAVRMGLYAVNPADPTKARTAKQAAGVYATIAQEHRITLDLATRYPDAPEAAAR